jgi:hypothetical protein
MNHIILFNGSATSNDLETTKTILASTRTELDSTKFALTDLATKFNGKILHHLLSAVKRRKKKFPFNSPNE